MILITIGTNPSNRITFDKNNPKLKFISGHHAEIKVRDDGSIFIIDRTSMNGTKVKGQRIQPEVEVAVNRGDKITFADVADLDWSKVPIIAPIDPQKWSLYSIGSDLNNRIQISDAGNTVSRFHATLKIERKTGKKFIVDHSTNGTFVNGQKIPSNQDIPVKKKDSIVFANNAPFNWSLVKEKSPISFMKIAASIAAILVIGLGIWMVGLVGDKKVGMNEINELYSNSVVCVYHQYAIHADVILDDGSTHTVGVLIMDVPLAKQYRDDLVTPDINKEDNAFIYYVFPGSKAYPLIFNGGTGTAFFVDNKGTMLTNRHITMPWENDVEKCKVLAKNEFVKEIYGKTDYVGITFNGRFITRMTDFIECTVLSSTTDDRAKDVGLLRTKEQRLPDPNIRPIDLKNAVIDAQEIKVGEKVFMLGYPLGINMFTLINDKTTTNAHEIKLTGQAGDITQVPDRFKFGHNAPAINGSSGSPMFNSKGQLIGILNAGLGGVGIHGYNWGILAKHAKELYEK